MPQYAARDKVEMLYHTTASLKPADYHPILCLADSWGSQSAQEEDSLTD